MHATPTHAADPAPIRFDDPAPGETEVAVIGGGFSGLMTAAGILRRHPSARVAVFERHPRRCPGAAYGGCDPTQLLNVRADRMGAAADDPGAFSRWLDRCLPGRHGPDDFAPRSLYGRYLNETAAAGFAPHRRRLSLVRAAVGSIDIGPRERRLRLATGGTTDARVVVLALGLPAAAPAWPGGELGETLRDPWSDGAFDGLAPEDPVLVVGTGLTALDVLVALDHRGHRGPLTFLSRNGRFPLPHSDPRPGVAPATLDPADLATPRGALAAVRALARRCVAEGRPWQDALDAVRPHTTATWRRWSDAERARFLRHLRPMWEIHRHRAPAQVLALVARGLASGTLRVLRGTVERQTPLPAGGAEVAMRLAGARSAALRAARIFHCIGPAMRVDQGGDPLLRALLADGSVVADAAGLGLRADERGRALARDGRPRGDLLLLGALRRGDLWESTAVPELRLQVETVADEAARILAASPVH